MNADGFPELIPEAPELIAMMSSLDEIAARLQLDLPSDVLAGASVGRTVQALTVASQALFDVVNLGSSHLHCRACRRELDRRFGRGAA